MMKHLMTVENDEGKMPRKKGMFDKRKVPSMHMGSHMGSYRRGLEAHMETMMPTPKKRRIEMADRTTTNGNFNTMTGTDELAGCGELIGPRSAQGLVVIKAQFEPEANPKVLPAFTLAFAKSQQSGGVVHIDNYDSARPTAKVIGITLEDALDATKLMDEHASRRTVAIAVGGVVALHCPPAFAKEFVFGDPVYISSNSIHSTVFQGIPMRVPSWNKEPSDKMYNCRIGTFVEQVDARSGGIRLKLDIGVWEGNNGYVKTGNDEVAPSESPKDFADNAGYTEQQKKFETNNVADQSVATQQRYLSGMGTLGKTMAVLLTGLVSVYGAVLAGAAVNKGTFYRTMANLFKSAKTDPAFAEAFAATENVGGNDDIVKAFLDLAKMNNPAGSSWNYPFRILGTYAKIVAGKQFGTANNIVVGATPQIQILPDAGLNSLLLLPEEETADFIEGILSNLDPQTDAGAASIVGAADPGVGPGVGFDSITRFDDWDESELADAIEYDDTADAFTAEIPDDKLGNVKEYTPEQMGAMFQTGLVTDEDVVRGSFDLENIKAIATEFATNAAAGAINGVYLIGGTSAAAYIAANASSYAELGSSVVTALLGVA